MAYINSEQEKGSILSSSGKRENRTAPKQEHKYIPSEWDFMDSFRFFRENTINSFVGVSVAVGRQKLLSVGV